MTSTVEDATNVETLVSRALGGESDAFAAIYDRFADRIHDFCTSILRDPHDASDATQETFVLAWQRLRQLREPSRLGAWLYAIARRECLRRLRGRARQVPVSEVPEDDDGGVDPDDVLAEAELRELVWDAAAGLEPRDRVVLDLNVRQGLGGVDIAIALGVRADHAHVLVSNVRRRVERSLGALLVLRVGRRDCERLRELLADWDGRFTPGIRKRVTRHVDGCEVCGARRARLASPSALLSTVPLAPAPLTLKETVLGRPELARPPTRRGLRRFPPREHSSTGKFAASAVAVGTAALVAGGVWLARGDSGGSGDAGAVRDAPASTEPVTTAAPPGAPGETFCSVSAELVAALPARGPASPAPADVEAYFVTQGEHLDRLVPLAPPAIAADVVALRDGVAAANAELAVADYAPTALADVGDDPVLAAANDRVESFIATECDLP